MERRRSSGAIDLRRPHANPETDIAVIVGGNGERRTLDIAARLGDACNLPANEDVLARKLAVLDGHLSRAGRTRDDVAVTAAEGWKAKSEFEPAEFEVGELEVSARVGAASCRAAPSSSCCSSSSSGSLLPRSFSSLRRSVSTPVST